MTHADSRAFDDFAPEADAMEQLTPVGVDEDDEAVAEPGPVRISAYADANEADLIEQAIAVPFDDDLEFDR